MVVASHPLARPTPMLLYLLAGAGLGLVQYSILGQSVAAGVDSAVSHAWFLVLGYSLWHFLRQIWQQRLSFAQYAILGGVSSLAVAGVWVLGAWAMLDFLGMDTSSFHDVHSELPLRFGVGVLYAWTTELGYFLYLIQQDRRSRMDNEKRLRDSLRESELDRLKARIHPHFLFNSLNSASMLTLSDPERASEMLVALSEFLRRSISGNYDSMTSLGEELRTIRRYLSIESIRFGPRLVTTFSVPPEAEDFPVPDMLLQPIYENAIKHGLFESLGTVEIATVATVDSNRLSIEIRNGCDPDAVPRKGTGFGLRSIRERLELLYGGDNAWLETERQPQYFAARVVLPRGLA